MVSDNIIDQGIRCLSSLVELELPLNPHITDEGVKMLSALIHLQKVSFALCKRVGDEGVLYLATILKRLRNVLVRDSAVSMKAINTLRSQHKITVVDID